ncbi:hypothetical protein [Corallococcus sp. RDP092CA]|uniref:hypothetical protein n=1 Tax=Corallococcus sp. RDP092CA TaxID=3109369 RepID=UPI0035B4D45B
MSSPFAEHFPALRSGFSYLDNAAGAQVPTHCIDAIHQFLMGGSSNVGQPYPLKHPLILISPSELACSAAHGFS